MVLESILPWLLKDNGGSVRKNYYDGENGDTSDMTVYAYFLREDGSVYSECTWTYMNLEYYRGSYTGIKRIYKALSTLCLI